MVEQHVDPGVALVSVYVEMGLERQIPLGDQCSDVPRREDPGEFIVKQAGSLLGLVAGLQTREAVPVYGVEDDPVEGLYVVLGGALDE